jgi:hypothetical protein
MIIRRAESLLHEFFTLSQKNYDYKNGSYYSGRFSITYSMLDPLRRVQVLFSATPEDYLTAKSRWTR